jgi:hypothetical protein
MLDRKRTRIGSEVWGVFAQEAPGWRVGLVGKVERMTSEGVYIRERQGRKVVEVLVGWTEHPVELTEEAMRAWAVANPPAAPGISDRVS